MKIHRFIAPVDIFKDQIEIRDPELVHQINRVLKLEVGEQVLFGDGKGHEALTVLETVSKSLVEARVLSHQTNENEPEKRITLCLAILKKDNFELAIQKAVESGVWRIVPILTERTVKIGINSERIQTIIKEAAEQSGRGILPELADMVSFEEAISRSMPETTVLFDLSGDVFTPETSGKTEILFIGPEGGFTDAEVSMAREKGCTISSLGMLTLRGETAAIIGTYRAVHSI